ncbi:MAG: hypothetical protein LBU09_04865 [Endomicrobium sp.]|jgi:hypothetical protein|nr:hypothetical protein [Endomicrobium sp.]
MEQLANIKKFPNDCLFVRGALFLKPLLQKRCVKIIVFGELSICKVNIKVIVVVFSALLNFASVNYCYGDDMQQYQDAKTSTLLWRTPIYAIANGYLGATLHEGSHALLGTALGWDIKDSYI